jgi:hypothetical protein
MPKRYTQQQSDFDIGPGYNAAQGIIQSELSRTAPLDYSFSDLEKKYPMKDVRRIFSPQETQDEINEEELQRKTTDLALKQKQYDMMMMDAKLNNENLRLSQVPEVMKRIGSLNPQTETFQKDLVQLATDLPKGFEDANIQNFIVKPLLNTHNSYVRDKQILGRYENKVPTYKDVEQAQFDIDDLVSRQKMAANKEIDPITEQVALPLTESEMMRLNYAQSIMQRAQGQPSGTSQQTGVPTTQQRNFSPKQLEALQWLQQNPDDSRAAAIKQKLGI